MTTENLREEKQRRQTRAIGTARPPRLVVRQGSDVAPQTGEYVAGTMRMVNLSRTREFEMQEFKKLAEYFNVPRILPATKPKPQTAPEGNRLATP
jgi:hypothetical protein